MSMSKSFKAGGAALMLGAFLVGCGLVDGSYSIENAESVARGISGVTQIINNVSVDR